VVAQRDEKLVGLLIEAKPARACSACRTNH
jgi:hypothetical protein